MQIISDGTRTDKRDNKIGGSELYAIPIQINSEVRNVFVSCNYPEETFTIIGMPCAANENGLPSGQMDGFKAGDVINSIYLNFKNVCSEQKSDIMSVL